MDKRGEESAGCLTKVERRVYNAVRVEKLMTHGRQGTTNDRWRRKEVFLASLFFQGAARASKKLTLDTCLLRSMLACRLDCWLLV